MDGEKEKREDAKGGSWDIGNAAFEGHNSLKRLTVSNCWAARNAIKIINYGSGKERFSLPASRARSYAFVLSF